MTADPVLGIILYFACGPVGYFYKYSNLRKYLQLYGDGQEGYGPEVASVEKLIGLIVAWFFSFILGVIFFPFLILIIAIPIFLIVLNNRRQQAFNQLIRTA